jgi:hypothetical protein
MNGVYLAKAICFGVTFCGGMVDSLDRGGERTVLDKEKTP